MIWFGSLTMHVTCKCCTPPYSSGKYDPFLTRQKPLTWMLCHSTKCMTIWDCSFYKNMITYNMSNIKKNVIFMLLMNEIQMGCFKHLFDHQKKLIEIKNLIYKGVLARKESSTLTTNVIFPWLHFNVNLEACFINGGATVPSVLQYFQFGHMMDNNNT